MPRRLALLVLVLPACGGADAPAESPSAPAERAAPSSPQRARAAPVTATGTKPYDSATLGALHGRILFRGEPPERFPLVSSQSPECMHHPEVDQRQNVVVVTDGGLAGAFVTLRSGHDASAAPTAPAEPVTLHQKGCMYVPRVLALRVGQTLRVTNEDPTTHNVNVRAKRNASQNKNMGAGQSPLALVFERAERPVPFKCDIHPWMGAAVFVEEHPWFAVTDERGEFEIRDVPPGEYVVAAYHEILDDVSGSVTVTAGTSTGFTLTLAK
jgi:plastocyanin